MDIEVETTVTIEAKPRKLSVSVSAAYLLAALLPKGY